MAFGCEFAYGGASQARRWRHFGTVGRRGFDLDRIPVGIGRPRAPPIALHVGDIHSGKEFCTQSFDLAIFNQWKAFTIPLVYVPGDNDWADCQKV